MDNDSTCRETREYYLIEYPGTYYSDRVWLESGHWNIATWYKNGDLAALMILD